MTAAVAQLTLVQPGRESRDRLEILTALIEGPGFEPLFRDDIIQIPKNHPVLHWNCLIDGCDGYIRAQELCGNHLTRWRQAETAGVDRLEFLRTAPLVDARKRLNAPANCRVRQCGRPAERNMLAGLCTFHRNRWQEFSGSVRVSDDDGSETWLSDQDPCASYGQCVALCCTDLARSPQGLCEDHEKLYRQAGRPGGARLPANWGRWFDHHGQQDVPISYGDEAAFRRWCRHVQPAARPGQISLHGMSPLIKAELKWGLHSYTQRSDHTRWWMHSILPVVDACRSLASLEDYNLDGAGEHERMIVGEIRRDLEIVYVTPSESKEAGYLDFEHFGRRVAKLNSRFDLALIPQRWLRDLLWDHLADLLRSGELPPRAGHLLRDPRRGAGTRSVSRGQGPRSGPRPVPAPRGTRRPVRRRSPPSSTRPAPRATAQLQHHATHRHQRDLQEHLRHPAQNHAGGAGSRPHRADRPDP